MHLAIRRLAILVTLAVSLAGTVALGQQNFGEDNEKVGRTREELWMLLRQYPPRLGEVLKLDPSLLSNEGYLSPYPEIRAFLGRHPEVVRDPGYFFGNISSELEELRRRASEAELSARYRTRSATENVLNTLIPFAIFFAVIGILGWLIRRFQEHRQWLRVWRTQSEAHSKLMDRMTTNEDMLAYLNTPAGKRFFESSWMPPVESAPVRPSVPVSRIIWSVQAGLLLLLGGISLRFVYGDAALGPEDLVTLNIFSVVAIGLGVSFILGAAASFMISARLGLIEPPAPARRPPSIVEPPPST
jgi:hypothetical protein